MNKLFTDIQYIELMNNLGEHLSNEYGLNVSQTQEVKYKLNLIIEEIVRKEYKLEGR